MKVPILILVLLVSISENLNTKLLEIEENQLNEPMKEFITYIIEKNGREKDGFLFILINYAEAEYSDFALKKINENGSAIIVNFDANKNYNPNLNPNHFKFVFCDPEGELGHSQASFNKVKSARAKILLILTKPPPWIFVTYVLNSYTRIKCFNVILVYEFGGKIQVYTNHPYLPVKNKIVNLTSVKYTQDLFEDKSIDLKRTTIKALLTYNDKTKIRITKDRNNITKFEGKDFEAINTIITHLNGVLEVETLDNVFINPWFESIEVEDRLDWKKSVLTKRKVSILIKSEPFTQNDGVLETLHPHTQNDLCALVPKSSLIPIYRATLNIFTFDFWIVYFASPYVMLVIMVVITKLQGSDINKIVTYQKIVRIHIVNHLLRFPKNSVERLLLFNWLLCCYLINTTIQSKITSVLTVKTSYPDVTTINELFSSDFEILGLPNNVYELQKKYNGTEFSSFVDSVGYMPSNEGLMDNTLYREDTAEYIPALITEHDIAIYMSRHRIFRRNGAPLYHLVRESLIPNYQSYKVIHSSPLLPIMNKELRRLEEAGFIELWAKRHIYTDTINGILYPENYDADIRSVKPLAFDVVVVPLWVLLMGNTIALTVFIIENIVHWKTKPKVFIYVN